MSRLGNENCSLCILCSRNAAIVVFQFSHHFRKLFLQAYQRDSRKAKRRSSTNVKNNWSTDFSLSACSQIQALSLLVFFIFVPEGYDTHFVLKRSLPSNAPLDPYRTLFLLLCSTVFFSAFLRCFWEPYSQLPIPLFYQIQALLISSPSPLLFPILSTLLLLVLYSFCSYQRSSGSSVHTLSFVPHTVKKEFFSHFLLSSYAYLSTYASHI